MLQRVSSKVVKSGSILVATGLMLLAGGFSSGAIASCGDMFSGNRTYYFSGKLQVQGEGGTNALEGAQVRVVRKHSPVKWANVGSHGTTDNEGAFNIQCDFARDRNGAVARGKKIIFKIQVRFRNDDLKIRKGGWFKNNWHTIATRRGCKRSEKKRPWKNIPECKEFSFPDLDKTFDTSERVGKHAYLFWFYTYLQAEMAKRDVGLYNRPFFTHRIGVTYPDKNVFKNDVSWFLFNIHIAQDDWNEQRTLIHEWMHRWDVGNLGGEAHMTCLFDKHHKGPDKKLVSRCGGFMEGFAEAAAQRLTVVLDNVPDSYGDILTLEDLRKGNGKYDSPIDSLRDAQRTDEGWMNFIKLFWTENEWSAIGGNPGWADEEGCNPHDVSVFEMLQAMRRESPRKGGIFKPKGNSTFAWFTDFMQQQIADFGKTDAQLYRMMGNPGHEAQEIYDEVCASDVNTAGKTLQPELVDPVPSEAVPKLSAEADISVPVMQEGFSGQWNSDYGQLQLHQVGRYVIGDYADAGIMLGQVSGSCVAGVFTNGDRSGRFRFERSDGERFEGDWAWYGEPLENEWSGRRTGDADDTLENFVTPGGKALDTLDNDRDVFDGVYESPFGDVALMQRDLFLIGDYAEKGIIAGLWDGNSFRGYFTNDGRTGWFDFAFLSKNGSFRRGEWNWFGEESARDWPLLERSGQTPDVENMTRHVSCEE